MKGPEIHPAVDANNVQAKRNAEAFSEATQRAVAEATVLAEVVKHRRRKRAVISLLLRVVVAIAINTLSILCRQHGLMDWEVSFAIFTGTCAWLSLWVGAWLQFMWCKEGLLR